MSEPQPSRRESPASIPPLEPDMVPIVLSPQVTRPLVTGLGQLLRRDIQTIKAAGSAFSGLEGQSAELQQAAGRIGEAALDIYQFVGNLEKAGELRVIPNGAENEFEVATESSDPPKPGEVILEGDDWIKVRSGLSHQIPTRLSRLVFAEMVRDGYGDPSEELKQVAVTIANTVTGAKQKLAFLYTEGIRMITDEQGNTTFIPLSPPTAEERNTQPSRGGLRPPEPSRTLDSIVLQPRITRPLAASVRQILGQEIQTISTTVAGFPTEGQSEDDQHRITSARQGTTSLDELLTNLTNAGDLQVTPRTNGPTFEFLTQSSEPPQPGEVVLEGADYRTFVGALGHQVATQLNPIMLIEMVDNEDLQQQAGTIVEKAMAMNQNVLSLANAGGLKMTTDQEGNTTFTLLPFSPTAEEKSTQ